MLNFKRQKYGQETSSEDPKIWRPWNRNTMHLERKHKSDISNNRGNWNHFIIIQKIPDQHNRKAWNQWTEKKSLTGHYRHTTESTNMKVQNLLTWVITLHVA